jgi:hypothetical protein
MSDDSFILLESKSYSSMVTNITWEQDVLTHKDTDKLPFGIEFNSEDRTILSEFTTPIVIDDTVSLFKLEDFIPFEINEFLGIGPSLKFTVTIGETVFESVSFNDN